MAKRSQETLKQIKGGVMNLTQALRKIEEQKMRILHLERDLNFFRSAKEARIAAARAAVDAIARQYNVSPNQIFCKQKSQHISEVRHACMWLIRNRMRMTYPMIGRAMQRNHSTIIHGVSVASSWKESNPYSWRKMNTIGDNVFGKPIEMRKTATVRRDPIDTSVQAENTELVSKLMENANFL